MRRILLMYALMLFVVATVSEAREWRWSGKTIISKHNRLPATGQSLRHDGTDEIIFQDDFEEGLQWITHDLTTDPGAWHIDTFNAYGGSGHSWWCGDPALGGYRDDWYMVLDTPPIDLAGATSPVLSFQSRYSCENPAGATDPWDGWDGLNIRISIDNGVTWTILGDNVITPNYTCNSLYSFGQQHHEGPNIPGWAGQSTTWSEVTANLAAFVDDTVRIRFPFASDPDVSTTMYPEWFGWQIDEIDVSDSSSQIFHSSAEDTTGFRIRNVQQVGGDLWHVETWTNPAPPSPTHVLRCGTVGGSYNPDMHDAVVSPYIDLTSYVAGTCSGDFMVTGDISDPDPSPDLDYWYVEISPDSGVHWYNVTNPWGSPQGQNYVYTDVPATWSSFVNTFNYANLDFSEYLGHVCQFRIVLESDEDVPTGMGLLIDDVWIDYSSALPNDVGCTALHIPFPTAVGFQAHGEAVFSNLGTLPAYAVPPRWQVQGASPVLLTPFLSLQVGQSAIRSFDWTPTTAGSYWLKAWTEYVIDENRSNDTCTAAEVVVTPQNQWVLGYDNRTFNWRFNYATGTGAACRFTPADDGIPWTINVQQAQFLFDMGQAFPEDFDLVIFEGDASEVPGEEITTITVTVQPGIETNPNWKIVDLSGVPELQGRTGNFWFWLKVTNTGSGDRYPEILGDDQMWGDGHFFVYNGSQAQPSIADYMIRALVTPASGINHDPGTMTPGTFRLEQNYPNPFNPMTTIQFGLPHDSPVTLEVYNLMGQTVALLVDRNLEAGTHRVDFQADDFPSGIYFYRLEASGFVDMKKMVFLK